MVYLTGDIHGESLKIKYFCREFKLTAEDIIIILGDVGANYYGNSKDKTLKYRLSELAPTILCIHGNHEQRPGGIEGYHLKDWKGGKVWVQDEYPSLLFAKDGEVFNIDGVKYLVIGGAYSVDKEYRLARGFGWWADEQPSQEIKAEVEKAISEKPFDAILSHTCPYKYEPREMFLSMIDQSKVDTSTEEWLDRLEETIEYKAWFCGHWHTDKRIDKMHFLFHSFESDEMLRTEVTENG